MPLPHIADWPALAARAQAASKPVVLLIEQAVCPFCRTVEDEFFAAILAAGPLRRQALFGKISIDEGATIRDQNGRLVGTRDFLSDYQAGLTPTVLFLDHAKTQVADKIIGLLTPDFYGFYLEQGISAAIAAVNSD